MRRFFRNKRFPLYRLEVWDTNGQELYRSLAPLYYRKAQAAVVVFDVTERQTFEDADSWVKELRHYAEEDMVIALVGNKVDLESRRKIDAVEASDYALSRGTFVTSPCVLRRRQAHRPSYPIHRPLLHRDLRQDRQKRRGGLRGGRAALAPEQRAQEQGGRRRWQDSGSGTKAKGRLLLG